MAIAVAAERVRRDVEVLSRAGLDIETYLGEVEDSLRRALPFMAACVATCDPVTGLLTGTYKFGDLYGRDERDQDWGTLEYGNPEPTSFIEMAAGDQQAAAVSVSTGGDVERSPRMREFMIPYLGYTDELRMLFRTGGQLWGAVALFRDEPGDPFNEQDVEYAATLSAMMATGVRSSLLVRVAQQQPPDLRHGPGVLIVDRNNTITQMSLGAEEQLAALLEGERTAAPITVIGSLVGSARRFAAGTSNIVPRARVRSRSGTWFVLHASPMAGPEANGATAITIEEARPPEIVPLVVAAFGLTPRERDVVSLVLQGVETKDIAQALHVSTYTVQDHLKSVFEKAEVRSRRELIARVFFDQYAPRMGIDLAPSGWFAS